MLPYVVIACSVAFFWSVSIRTIIYTAMPVIAGEMQLSSSVAGMVLSSLLLAICVAGWSSGWLPGSRKTRILAGVILSVPAVVVVSVALDVWALMGACVLVGLGVGVYRPLGLSILIAAGGTTRKARYIAVHETAAALASFAGAAFIGVSLGWFGWRTALLLFCVVGVVALLVFTRLQDRESRMMAGTREPVPIDRTLAFSCIAFTACNMMNAGLISVLPLIMVRAWAIDPGYAAWTLGWAKLANMAGVLVAGARADAWGQERVLRWSQILTIAGCLAMSVGGFGVSFLSGLLMISVGAGAMVTVLPSVITDAYSVGQRERVLSTSVGGSHLLGSVICPPVFGAMLDAGWPGGPMLVSAAIIVVALVTAPQISRRRLGGTQWA